MKNSKKTILICLLIFQQSVFSIDFKKIEEHVANTPHSSTKSTEALSKYLTSAFEQEDEKFAAIYFWVGKNIRYDVNQKNQNRKYFSTKEIVNEVMKHRKGVCQHYSELFHELSRLAGLKSYVVSGYGKEYEKVMNLAHVWNVIEIDSTWYLVDVTWGAGYLYRGQYKNDFKLKYFMVEPAVFIVDHIPFDPMWQLLSFPIKYDEFDFGTTNNNVQKRFYYKDTIKIYVKLPVIEQKINTVRRIESNGKKNKLVLTELNHEREYIKIARKNEEIKNLNSGNYYYNEAVKQLNEFYELKQKKTKGKKVSNSKLMSELSLIEKNLNIAKKHYAKVKTTDKDISYKLKKVNSAVSKFEKIIVQQKGYLGNN